MLCPKARLATAINKITASELSWVRFIVPPYDHQSYSSQGRLIAALIYTRKNPRRNGSRYINIFANVRDWRLITASTNQAAASLHQLVAANSMQVVLPIALSLL